MKADERLALARAAQREWALVPVRERARLLRGLRHGLLRRADAFVEALTADVGKPPMDAMTGDVMVTLEQMLFYEREAGKLLAPRKAGKPAFYFEGCEFVEYREPHGVVLVCAPWNYPLQLALVPAVTALFAGNAVVVKGSEMAPRTAALLEELLRECKLPEGLAQVVCGPAEVGSALLEAGPDFVFFTGSSANGQAVAAQAARLLLPAVLELGGKDAAVVFASCDLERTVRGLVYGAFSNSGQVCVGTKRIYVEASAYPRFVERFVCLVRSLRMGTDVDSDVGVLRVRPMVARLEKQIQDAVERGARVLCGWDGGCMCCPVVLEGVASDAGWMREESFGPVVCLQSFVSEEEAVAMANASAFALSASVWTGNAEQGARVAMRMECGTCSVNDVVRNIGNPEVAFGGNKSSGYGRYRGAEGLRAMTRVKTVMTARKTKAQEVHWFPFTKRGLDRLRAVLVLRHGEGSLARRMREFMRLLWVLPVLACAVSGVALAGGELIVDVALPAGAHGKIGYLVFSSASGFPDNRDHALRHGFEPVAGDKAVAQIDLGGLAPGEYAVSVYLDTNGNGKLDKGWMGIPKEPVGVSNNPKVHFGPPSYSEAEFGHGAAAQTITINLVHK